jgi:polar amino acid transport system substrate-binding protein
MILVDREGETMSSGISLKAIGCVLIAVILSACGGAEVSPSATPVPAPTDTYAPLPTLTPLPEDDDWSRVKASGKLLVGTSLDNPPFSYYGVNYQPDGFDIALMTEIARRLGLRVEFNDFAFEGLPATLQLRQVDAAIAAIAITPERQAAVGFSDIYYVGQDGVLAAADGTIGQVTTAAQLAQYRVGVQRGSVYETWLLNSLVQTGQMPAANLMAYLKPDDAVRDLAERRIDVVVLDLLPARAYEGRGQARLVGLGMNAQTYGIAARKSSNLLGQINLALAQAQADGTTSRLIQQYLQLSPEQIVPVPTLAPLPTPTSAPVATPAPPACLDGMAWVADLNLEDGNMSAPPSMQPGQGFTKGWRVRNSGNCDWRADYTFTYANGNTPAARMGGQPMAMGRAVRPGEQIDVHVNLVAPYAPGVYQGFWQMTNSGGVSFGETVWVGIRVPAPPTPIPPATQTPAPGISFSVDRTSITAGECVVFNWMTANVNAVYFYPQGQPYQNYGVPGTANQTVCPSATTTYELRVEKRDGSAELRQMTIGVAQKPGAPLIVQFGSAPEYEVVAGQCLNFFWTIQGSVTRVALLKNGRALWDGAPAAGSYGDCPAGAGTVTYELQASGPGGTARQQRAINVRAPQGATPTPLPTQVPPGGQPPAINRLSATEQTTTGTCVWVSWELGGGTTYAKLFKNNQLYADNAQTASSIAAFSGNANGDCDTQSAGTIVYRLEAYNPQGQMVWREAATQISGPMPR